MYLHNDHYQLYRLKVMVILKSKLYLLYLENNKIIKMF